MIHVLCIDLPIQSLKLVYHVLRMSLRLFYNLKISFSHTFGQGPKMSPSILISLVELGRHLEWFLELTPVLYLILYFLYNDHEIKNYKIYILIKRDENP